jgi:hypothetical protein
VNQPDRPFIDANSLLDMPDPEWQIEKIMPQQSLMLIYSKPGALKTALADSIALSVAHNLDCLGIFPVKSGPVAFLSPEGVSGHGKRFKAWMKNWGVKKLQGVKFNGNTYDLTRKSDVDVLIGHLQQMEPKPVGLVIDTLSRCFGASDENNTRDMNVFIRNVDRIKTEIGCFIIIVHHSGKLLEAGARGSIALEGAADVIVELKRTNPDTVIVRCKKMKDGAEFEPFTIHRVVHEVGRDSKGKVVDAVTTIYGSTLSETAAIKERAKEISQRTKIFNVLPTSQREALKLSKIAKLSKVARTTVRRYLEVSARKGLVESVGEPKHWFLSQKGRELSAVQPSKWTPRTVDTKDKSGRLSTVHRPYKRADSGLRTIPGSDQYEKPNGKHPPVTGAGPRRH